MISPIKFLWALPALLCAAVSCKKVIEVDFDEAASRYVIEGKIDNNGYCSVLVSLSQLVTDVTSFNGVDSAQVSVTEEGGATVTLKRVSKGGYQQYFKGMPGKTYRLTVSVKESVFTASCTMPARVNMDSLFITTESISGSKRYVANVNYVDPAGQNNYYNFIQSVNRKKAGIVYVNDDHLNNGKAVTFPLLYEGNLADSYTSEIKRGDTVQVEMQNVDPAVYKYWYSLKAGASGEDIMATPANPVTNISGGALGYFSAHTAQYKKVIVK